MFLNSFMVFAKGALCSLPLIGSICIKEELKNDMVDENPAATQAQEHANIPAHMTMFDPNEKNPQPLEPHRTLLPEDFKVYYHSHLGLSTKPYEKDGEERTIANKNEFNDEPGCYVACYSDNKNEGIYSVHTNQYIIGQFRLKGEYQKGLCVPEGMEKEDLRQSQAMKEKCEQTFPDKCPNGSCRAGGYTLNLFTYNEPANPEEKPEAQAH